MRFSDKSGDEFTHRQFTPRTAYGDDFFTVEELLLETLRKRRLGMSVCRRRSGVPAFADSPSHTVCICPPVCACEPSDASARSAVTQEGQKNKKKQLLRLLVCPVCWQKQRRKLTSRRHRDPPSLKVGLHLKLICGETRSSCVSLSVTHGKRTFTQMCS